MTTYTPGPWEAIPHPKDWVIKQRVTTFTETRFPTTVARVERDVNAQLIATAPELLAMVRSLAKFIADAPSLDYGEDKTLSWIAVQGEAARALIAKATGGTP